MYRLLCLCWVAEKWLRRSCFSRCMLTLAIDRYWAYKNAWSMDGMPGMQRALVAGKREKVAPIKKMVGPLAPKGYSHGPGIALPHVILVALVSFVLGLALAANASVLLEGSHGLDVDMLKGWVAQGSY